MTNLLKLLFFIAFLPNIPWKCVYEIFRIYSSIVIMSKLLFKASVQFSCSVMSDSFCDSMDCSMPGFPFITNYQSLLKLMSIKLVMPSNHLILCCPLLSPSIFPSIRVFSNESALCISCSKYWSFSFSISSLYEYSGLISLRIDCLELFAVQGTPKSLLHHHSSKASILQCSASIWSNSHIHT